MTVKKTALTICLVLAVALLLCGVVTVGARSDDPADSYSKIDAPYEDYDIEMWFDYSFRKNFTSDTASTDMDTFSIHMAKNEIESCQFVLFSEEDKPGMKAEITDFTDKKGNTVPAQLYYEMYVTTENLNLYDTVYGESGKSTTIREGETPDPIAPLDSIGTFKLVGGKSQSFLIRCKSSADTVSGWYSATLNIKNSDGKIVKTAEVFLYVWDFELSEKTEFRTALFLDNDTTYRGSYEDFYDYLLENRMCAMDLPGGASYQTKYLTNDRVNSIRITATGNGAVHGSYMDGIWVYKDYLGIYNKLAQREDWDEIKGKFYAYTVDEPTTQEQADAIKVAMGYDPGFCTTDDAIINYNMISSLWPGVKAVVPLHTNSPYPTYTYHKSVSSYQDYEVMDGIQGMMDADAIQIWCPQLYYFTPSCELNTVGPDHGILDENGSISDFYSVANSASPTGYYYVNGVYNWRQYFGEFSDRVKSYIAKKKNAGEDYELWTYRAGSNAMYTYCHHLIENTGLQTKLLFWQCYQEGITGYLYYDVNEWGSYVDTTPTGAKTNVKWRTNKFTYGNGYNIYGMGHLMYGVSQGYVSGVDVIGTIRVEILRDGIEEYQMLSMLSALKGEDASQSIVSQVSANVVNYLSLNNFSTSAWSSSMDEYDIMEAVRRGLGNQLEAAVAEEKCNHKWNDGEITKSATCLEIGLKQYTCTLCNATKTENVPSLHEEGSVFETVSELSTAATCTTDGKTVKRCTVCGYKRGEYVTAYHNDSSVLVYEFKNENTHEAYCPVCNEVVVAEGHKKAVSNKPATCVSEGLAGMECTICKARFNDEVTPLADHKYKDGYCTVCGVAEYIIVYGDLNEDGKVSAVDINILAKSVVGSVTLSEMQEIAGDVSNDGKISATDLNLISKYISGVVDAFPAET